MVQARLSTPLFRRRRLVTEDVQIRQPIPIGPGSGRNRLDLSRLPLMLEQPVAILSTLLLVVRIRHR